MTHLIDRRELVLLGLRAAGVVSIGATATTVAVIGASAQAASVKPPPLDKDLVLQFVKTAHVDLDQTKSMLAAQPRLINATWDWGGGDFETALGGASHMGRPDIAKFLLANGARMDVFCATMMGKLDVVRACVADNPAIVQVKGPHGISLLRHAQTAKQAETISFLQASGAS